MRAYIFLVIGLAVGVAGAILFIQSMPPPAGSVAERADKLEAELKRAKIEIAAMEAQDPGRRRRGGRNTTDRLRDIASDLREGRPVSPDDIFQATQPLMRDLAPIFDRLRIREAKRQADARAGELSRKYGLDERQQEALKKWFEQKAEDDAKAFNDLVSQDGARLEDIMKAARDTRPDEGLDNFMETTLNGEKLLAYKAERIQERADSVQQEADRRVERLDQIVDLDDRQRNQVFALTARGSRDFDPSMRFEGLDDTAVAPVPGQGTQDAVMNVLTPAQRQRFEERQQQKREEARKDLETMGLTLPPSWDLLDDGF